MDILRKKGVTVLLFALLFASGTIVTIASNQVIQKNKVIAAAIYKFIKFVDWENDSFNSLDEFNMCLQQYDSTFEPFTKRNIQSKTIKLLLLDQKTNISSCNAIYLNDSQSNDYLDIIAKSKTYSVLTISEQTGFLEAGGIIELANQNNRLTFSINQQAAQQGQLNVGFQLLSLARKVIEI